MKRWPWLALVALVAVAYAPAPWSEFVWDDQDTWTNVLPRFQGLRDVLLPPAGIATWSYAYYRPVVIGSYLLDVALWGPDSSTGPHLANVAYHAIVTLSVWLLMRRVLAQRPGREPGALAAAAIFAVHPIHTESVSWIAGRSDVLAAMFLLPCVLVALAWRDRGATWRLLLVPVLFLLGVLAKEIAITALALVPLALVLAPAPVAAPAVHGEPGAKPLRLRWAGIAAALAAATLLYLWLRGWVGVQASQVNDPAALAAAQQLLGAGALYLRKLLWPSPQSSILTWTMVPGPVAAATLALAATGATAWSARHWRRCGDGTFLFATCWFWVTLSVPLYAAVWAVSKTPLAERQMYLPSVALAIGLGGALCAAWPGRWRRGMLGAIGLLVVAGIAATVQRGLVWQDDLRLWSDATARAPDHGLAWLNLGLARQRSGDAPGGLDAFDRVTATDAALPVRARAQVLSGMLLLRGADPAQAERHFRAAITLRPELPEAYYGLGAVYMAQARHCEPGGQGGCTRPADLAVHFLQRALLRHDGYHPARLTLAGFMAERGNVLEGAGDRAGARALYRGALEQLDALLVRLPPAERDRSLEILQAETGVAAAELRDRLVAAIERSP